MKKEITWTDYVSLSLENSFGSIKKQNDIAVEFTIGIHESGESGWFELYDIESGGNEWYAEGKVFMDETLRYIVDYDGVFSIPEQILDKFEEWGYKTEEVR